ncbi:glutamate--tRNA ligase [Sulfurimonas hydrogeniphila]|uniref:glutamate--tRNA ligase n=1 Tax=Sulfurimonas hydrogeniphila TaxID=2509341 RepID=UPI00125F4666|nr:glutamate--tRNA ligase [Sulfurimonas hydrogeniphila]
MLRFASSPIGDMHINDLRIALLNYIVSKQKNEDFIVRIEDIDKEKVMHNKDQETLDILGLFGIEYSHVVYQSQNLRFHSAMALQLLHEKKAFSCFCSDEWLQKKRSEAEKAQKEYHYDDACRNLPAELVIDNTAPFTVRIVRPDTPVIVKDRLKGAISFEPDAVDSFVIMNHDKTPAYDFACAVDDMLSDVSMIICDEKYLNNTPKQVHVRNQLQYNKEIEYTHLHGIQNSVSVKQLLEEGYLPEAISNYLISIGSNPPKEIFTLKEATEWFDLDKLADNPVRFDQDRLKQINKEHLKNLDATELSRYVGFADPEIGELTRIYLEEAGTTKELKEKIASIFAKRVTAHGFAEEMESMAKAIKNAPYFEEYNDFKNYIMDKTGLKDENFLKPLRILLTNAEHGPTIEKVYKYLKNYLKEIIK